MTRAEAMGADRKFQSASLLALFLIAACPDEVAPSKTCAVLADCAAGERCVDGSCQVVIDDDAGTSQQDAGHVPSDGGSPPLDASAPPQDGGALSPESGLILSDAGNRSPEAGTGLADAGAQSLDAAVPALDASPPGWDGGLGAGLDAALPPADGGAPGLDGGQAGLDSGWGVVDGSAAGVDAGPMVLPCAGLSTDHTWLDAEANLRQVLCLDNTPGTESQSNVPILVRLTPSDVPIVRLGDQGDGMAFWDGDGNVLSHEIESFDSQEIIVWVRVPTVTAATGENPIWLYYARGGVPAPYDPTGVWNPEHIGVWHFSGGYEDATGQGLDGVVTAHAPAPGLISQGSALTTSPADGGTDGGFPSNAPTIEVGNDPLLDEVENGFTVSAWAKVDAFSQPWIAVVARQLEGTVADQLYLGIHDTRAVFGAHTVSPSAAESINAFPLGEWVHIAGSWDGVQDQLFIDGALVASKMRHPSIPSEDTPLTLGANINENNGPPMWADHLHGTIDEVRLENVARDAEWMSLQYRSMTDGLVTYGPVERRP
jgi:hypothetical protein